MTTGQVSSRITHHNSLTTHRTRARLHQHMPDIYYNIRGSSQKFLGLDILDKNILLNLYISETYILYRVCCGYVIVIYDVIKH